MKLIPDYPKGYIKKCFLTAVTAVALTFITFALGGSVRIAAAVAVGVVIAGTIIIEFGKNKSIS